MSPWLMTQPLEGSDLHFCEGEASLVAPEAVPVDAIPAVRAPGLVQAVEVRVVAVVVPPRPAVRLRARLDAAVVVAVAGGEGHAVVHPIPVTASRVAQAVT